MHKTFIYAGPSACDLPPIRRDELRWMPPVQRGDVDALVKSERAAGVLVICDGVFGGVPAVSHAELCRAIDAGWNLWGVSSIGAIRAYELRHQGMNGFGYVYEQFERFVDFADDEMCLIHVPDPPYFPVTEALVNLRYALDCRKKALNISERSAASVIDELRTMWFGDRSRIRIREVMVNIAGIEIEAADSLLEWTRLHRVKALDLANLLAARPWASGLNLRGPAS